MSDTIENTWLAGQPDDKVAKVKADMLARSADGPTNYLRYAGGHEDFATWLYLADRLCMRRIGLGIFDISDWNWRDAYDGGEAPGSALREALEADDTFGALFGGQ